jgi:hypothetical protein
MISHHQRVIRADNRAFNIVQQPRSSNVLRYSFAVGLLLALEREWLPAELSI